ncbi:hypothetical protein GCM10027432_29000 [Lysobacter fragariae]
MSNLVAAPGAIKEGPTSLSADNRRGEYGGAFVPAISPRHKGEIAGAGMVGVTCLPHLLSISRASQISRLNLNRL